MEEQRRILGRIIKVDARGYGFISSKEIEFTRIFFHWTALRQDTIGFKKLKTGMLCEFTPIEIPGKGHRAIGIRIVEQEKKDDMPTL